MLFGASIWWLFRLASGLTGYAAIPVIVSLGGYGLGIVAVVALFAQHVASRTSELRRWRVVRVDECPRAIRHLFNFTNCLVD